MAHLTCAAKHRPASWSGWRQAILPPRDAEAKASKSARGPRTGGQGPPGRREEIACPKISGRGSPARNVELFKPPPTVPSRDYTLHKYECGPPPTLSARRVPLRSLRSHDRASSNKCAVQPIRPSPSLRQAGRLSLAAALLAARSRARSRRSCRRRRAQNPAPVCRQPLPSHRRLAPAARAPVSRASAARAPAARAPAVLAASLADSHGAPVARRSDASAGAPAASISSHHHAAPTRSTSLSTSLLLLPDEQRLRKFNLLLEKEVCTLSHILCHIISHFPMLVPHATPHVPYTSSDSSSRSPGH